MEANSTGAETLLRILKTNGTEIADAELPVLAIDLVKKVVTNLISLNFTDKAQVHTLSERCSGRDTYETVQEVQDRCRKVPCE